MIPVIFDVHLMKAFLGGGVFDCHRPVLVVSDVGTGGLTGGHTHLTWNKTWS